MKIIIKLSLVAAVILFAVTNYRLFSFKKGISKMDIESENIIEFVNTISNITKVEYYKLPFADSSSDNNRDNRNSKNTEDEFTHMIYIETRGNAYLLRATEADINLLNGLSIFIGDLKPEMIAPIPFYVEIIICILILVIPFGPRKNKRTSN